MLILFDNGTPAPLRYALKGHVAVEAIELADHDVLGLIRSRSSEREVLDLLDEPGPGPSSSQVIDNQRFIV
jgi:hypothetical protein